MVDWTEVRRSQVGDNTKSVLPPRVKLPILPSAATEFSRLADDPDVSPAELGIVIERDAGLTCDLLRHVNSPVFAKRQRVSSAKHAIAALGIRESKLFILGTALKRSMRHVESKLINVHNFSTTNLERALFAREVALLLGAEPELAFAGGMLQDFLLPVVTNQLYPSYFDFVRSGEELALSAYERKTFGWDHAEAGALVMHGWGFPDDLVCCVLLHHRGLAIAKDPQLGRSAAAAVAVSALIPDALPQLPDGMSELRRLERSWPGFDLIEIAERVDAQFREMSLGLDEYTTLLRRAKPITARAF